MDIPLRRARSAPSRRSKSRSKRRHSFDTRRSTKLNKENLIEKLIHQRIPPLSPQKKHNPYDDYEMCRQACSYEDTEEGIADCIQDLIDQGNLCRKLSASTFPELKRLIKCFVKLLKVIYCIRMNHGNKFDAEFIRVVSKLVDTQTIFGFPLVALKEVPFPGDGTYRDGFPQSLYQYMMAMAYIDRAMNEGVPLHQYPPLRPFEEFVSDYQPWTRMLSSFVNQHGGNVPDISDPSHYGSFVKYCGYDYLLKDMEHLQENILRVIL
jgi:hypothetical protein